MKKARMEVTDTPSECYDEPTATRTSAWAHTRPVARMPQSSIHHLIVISRPIKKFSFSSHPISLVKIFYYYFHRIKNNKKFFDNFIG